MADLAAELQMVDGRTILGQNMSGIRSLQMRDAHARRKRS
jgi:hypothetical protein